MWRAAGWGRRVRRVKGKFSPQMSAPRAERKPNKKPRSGAGLILFVMPSASALAVVRSIFALQAKIEVQIAQLRGQVAQRAEAAEQQQGRESSGLFHNQRE